MAGAPRRLKRDHPLRVEQPETGVLKPQTAIRAIHETWGDDAVYVAGVGQHQMWSAQHIPYSRGRQWINSGGLGTMGFAVPAAIGAKVGVGRDIPVVAIDGDGCFQMTFQELATAVQHDIPVVFCVINNGYLGMVRQWQHLFYEDRLSQVALPQDLPDLMKFADAYGIPGFRVTTVDELDATLAEAAAITDQPCSWSSGSTPTRWSSRWSPSGASNDESSSPPRSGAPAPPPPLGRRPSARRSRRRTGGHVMSHTPGTPCRCWSRTSRASSRASPGMFARRSYNIESLAVGPTDDPRISRLTLVVGAEAVQLEQIIKQLNKLVHVLKILELEVGDYRRPRAAAGQGRLRCEHPWPDHGARRRLPREHRRRRPRRADDRGVGRPREARGDARPVGAVRYPRDGPQRTDRVVPWGAIISDGSKLRMQRVV